MAHDNESAAPSGEVIAVLGAGSTMGFAMARNMLKAGLRVRAWNRSAENDLDLPMLSAIAQRMTAGAEEHGDKDMAATYLTSTRRSG